MLRDAIAREVVASSLRGVAGEMSVSANGLRSFLNGAMPRRATRVKLESWLATRGQVTRPPNVRQFVHLLSELSGDLPPQQAMQLGRRVVDLLIDTYEARRLASPRWVKDLVRHYESLPGKRDSDVA